MPPTPLAAQALEADCMADKRENRLTEEDQKRVDEYLSTPVPSVERKPFRPLLLLFWLWVVVSVLGGVAWGLGKLAGYV